MLVSAIRGEGVCKEEIVIEKLPQKYWPWRLQLLPLYIRPYFGYQYKPHDEGIPKRHRNQKTLNRHI